MAREKQKASSLISAFLILVENVVNELRMFGKDVDKGQIAGAVVEFHPQATRLDEHCENGLLRAKFPAPVHPVIKALSIPQLY
jgi:hypothetical protein